MLLGNNQYWDEGEDLGNRHRIRGRNRRIAIQSDKGNMQ